MESFKNLKSYLRRLGILPWSSDPKAKIFVFLWNCFLFGLYVCYFLGPSWYVLSTAQTFENYIKMSFYLLTSLLMTLWYSVCVWQSAEYEALFTELGETMEKRKQHSDGIEKIYNEINDQIEMVSKKLHYLVMNIVIPLFTLLPIVFSIVKFISSSYSADFYHQIYPANYPFNWQTPFGYALCTLIQALTIAAAGELFSMVLIFVVGFSIFVTAFVADIEESLRQLNSDFIASRGIKNLNKRKKLKMKEKLFDIIEFHSHSIGLTKHFSNTNASLILAFFLYVTMSACSLLLQLNMLLETGNVASISYVIIMIMPVTFWLYLFCYFGDRVTESFSTVDRAFYELAWYELPLDTQNCLPMVISLAHKEIYLEGFGNINCTKEAFMKIMKTTSSYFMVLKEFTG